MKNEKGMVVRNEPADMPAPFGLWEEMDDLFNTFRRDMDRTFWDPFGGESHLPRLRMRRMHHYMPMNLEDKGEVLLLTVEMPGVKKEDTKISLDDDILTISVDSKEEKEETDRSFMLKERSSYSCQRSIRLPQEVMGEKVSARMEEGILHVTLPKKHPKEKKPKEIKVE